MGSGRTDVPEPNSEFVAVAAGRRHSLGLKADGSIVAWGWNNEGQTDVPAPNSGFVAVAAGHAHSLGLKDDGSIVGWGDDDRGQTDVPAPNTGFVAVAGGYSHILGLKADGSIVAWGWNEDGQTDVPRPNSRFVAVAVGGRHSLGLKAFVCVDNGECDDGVNCTVDACVDGDCLSVPNDGLCDDDGLFCNGLEICDAGLGCISTGAPCSEERTDSCVECLDESHCDDGVDCTVDACVDGDCSSVPNDGLCDDDGLFCSGEEVCDAQSGCISTGDPCAGEQACDEGTDSCRYPFCFPDPAWICDGDVDGDGQVNPVDSGTVQANFGNTTDQALCSFDLDCDGQINPVDSGIIQSLFGTCEAPRVWCP